jgi:inward rectifier potassium channel
VDGGDRALRDLTANSIVRDGFTMATSTSTTGAQTRGGMTNPSDPRLNIVRVNARRAPLSDLYHGLIKMPWHRFVLLLIGLYLSANLFFATVYTVLGDVIAGSHGFIDNFFFSVQTFATIGYGVLVPKSRLANAVVVVESMSGIFGVAMLTGLMFAKFARPSARIFFASRMVVARRNGQPVLMLRLANERGSFVVEAEAHVTVIKPEVTAEGERMRRVFDVPLVRDNQPWFFLSWTVMHPIDERSPLYGLDRETMIKDGVRLSINVMGFDSTVGQTVHATASYLPEQILFGHRYVDAFHTLPDGRLAMDYAKFDLVEPSP